MLTVERALGRATNPKGVTDEALRGHLAHAASLGLPDVEMVPPHGRDAVLIGGGPSLKDTWKRIRSFKGDVVTSNHTHDYLINRGIVPRYQVLLDPSDALHTSFKPDARVTYLLAATCHENTFAALRGHDVRVWYPQVMDDMRLPGKVIVPGGSTAPLRFLTLGYGMGYRRFRCFGLDGSVTPEGTHAYEHPTDPERALIEVVVDGRRFATTPTLARQADGFRRILKNFHAGAQAGRGDPVRVFTYGDALIPFIHRQMQKRGEI